MSNQSPLKILIVDDEPLARDRLRTLLGDLAVQLSTTVVGEAANGLSALEFLRGNPVDIVLADIRMPGMDGIELATHLGRLEKPPAVIFTTAYDNYAVQAFDLNAVDYLLKPVRAQRLLAALQKVPAQHPDPALLAGIGHEMRGSGRTHLSCHERGRLLLVPVGEVLYFKADLKYVTARTAERVIPARRGADAPRNRIRRPLHAPAPRRPRRQDGTGRLRKSRRRRRRSLRLGAAARHP